MPTVVMGGRTRWGRWRYYARNGPPARAAIPVAGPVFTLEEMIRVLESGAFQEWLSAAGYVDTNPYTTGAEAFVDYLEASANGT